MLRPSFSHLLSGRQILQALHGPTLPRWQSLIAVFRVYKHTGRPRGPGTESVQDRLARQFRTRHERGIARAEVYLGPLPSNARVLQQEFASGKQDPFNVLEEHLKDDKMDVAILRVCLTAAKLEIFKHKFLERSSAYKARKFNIAREVLQRIWGHPEIWLQIPVDPDAIYALCWFGVIKHLDDLIVKWIQADISSDTSTMELARNIYGHRIGIWRANILRSLLETQIAQPGKNADRALNCLFQIQDYQSTMRAQNEKWEEGTIERHLSIRPSVIGLKKALSTGAARRFPATNPRLFERFIEMFKELRGSDVGMTSDIADLWLCHPTSPNAEPLLELVRKSVSDASGLNKLNVPDEFLNTFRHSMRCAHPIFIASKWDADAKFIAEVYQNTYGKSIDAYEKDDEYRTKLPRGWTPPVRPT